MEHRSELGEERGEKGEREGEGCLSKLQALGLNSMNGELCSPGVSNDTVVASS